MQTKNLIKTLILPILLLGIIIGGCSKNGSVTGPNGNNNQVSFQISQQGGNNGGVQFLFKPAADVKISRIISKLPAEQFADTISYTNTNYVYSKDTTYVINEYTGIQAGQQWNFNFTGLGSNNSNYYVSVNYTAQ
jgi:hypothetical protein